jgi:hypothetical protein
MDTLDQLLGIISDGVADIKRVYVSADRPFPSLDEPYWQPDAFDEKISTARTLIVAAAQQLIAMVRLPAESVSDEALGVRLPLVSLGLYPYESLSGRCSGPLLSAL